MKIAVLSDVHLGYGKGTNRGEDSFRAFSEVIKKSMDADLILMAGDLFDIDDGVLRAGRSGLRGLRLLNHRTIDANPKQRRLRLHHARKSAADTGAQVRVPW